jgi:hypothetical protein
MRMNPSFWLSLLFVVLFGVGLVTAVQWSWDTRLFPWAIGIPAILLALCQLVLDLKGFPRTGDGGGGPAPQIMDITTDKSIPKEMVRRNTAVAFGWILAFVATIWLVGFLIAGPLFIFFYLWYQARATPKVSATIAGLMAIFIWGLFDQIMHVNWPEALILSLLGYY